MRIHAPPADDVAAGRGQLHVAEAGQERAREEERGADALGELPVDGVDLDPARDRRSPRWRPSHVTSAPREATISRNVSTSRMRGTFSRVTGSSASTVAARHGSAAFLLPAGRMRPREPAVRLRPGRSPCLSEGGVPGSGRGRVRDAHRPARPRRYPAPSRQQPSIAPPALPTGRPGRPDGPARRSSPARRCVHDTCRLALDPPRGPLYNRAAGLPTPPGRTHAPQRVPARRLRRPPARSPRRGRRRARGLRPRGRSRASARRPDPGEAPGAGAPPPHRHGRRASPSPMPRSRPRRAGHRRGAGRREPIPSGRGARAGRVFFVLLSPPGTRARAREAARPHLPAGAPRGLHRQPGGGPRRRGSLEIIEAIDAQHV